jgi:hypothetical protein
MVIFRIFCLKFWGLVWPGFFFLDKTWQKKLWTFLNPKSTKSHRLREIRKAGFDTKSFFLCIFQHFFKKLGFWFSQFSQWNYIETYNYLYSLDSKVYFFYHVLSRSENFLATLGPKTSDQKIRKMTIFKANLRLVKNSYCPRIIPT